MNIQIFNFNAFQENTYLIYDSTNECVIIDPGMTDEEEDAILFDFIEQKGLTPKMILNTHCHIDHILGVAAAKAKFNIPFIAHEKDMSMIERAGSAALMWNIPYRECPNPDRFIDEGEVIQIGEMKFDTLFVPGHAPGHLAFVCHQEKVVISGDVLFKGSVGRVDLPGCNKLDLIKSIQEKMYKLPDDYAVFSGHGEHTTIGAEKKTNHFVREDSVSF